MKPLKRVVETSSALPSVDPRTRDIWLKSMGGSSSSDWNGSLIQQVALSTPTPNPDPEARAGQMNGLLEVLEGIAPRDALEGMMAAQLMAAHNAAMECYRRANNPKQTFEGRREDLNQANKLSRTYAALVEALNRHRGKGEQKVTVEHVHVHAGGQAVVGSVKVPGYPKGRGE
jgi:hypothetical protein